METNTNQIALPETFKPEVFKKLIDSAPEVYETSKSRVEKALTVGNNLIASAETEISQNGRINDEIDQRLNNFIVNSNKAKKEINETRAPITNMFQTIVKLYTSLENSIDSTKPESLQAKAQILRNNYAKYKVEEQKKKDQELARQKAVENEKIAVRTAVEQHFRTQYIDYLTKIKSSLNKLFNDLTLDNMAINVEVIKKFDEVYPDSHYLSIEPNVTRIYITTDDVQLIVKEYQDISFYSKFATNYKKEISELKADLLLKVPGKKEELEAIAKAEAEALRLKQEAYQNAESQRKVKEAEAEALRLKQEAENREKEEAEKLTKQSEQDKSNAIAETEANKNVLQANTMFSMESSAAEVTTETKVKTSYEIEIISPAGYLPIISFFFQKEGNKKTVSELEKKTLGSMVTFAENYYNKNGEKVDSPYVQYKESFKAINTKK